MKNERLSAVEKEITPRRTGTQASGYSRYYSKNRSLNSRETNRYVRSKGAENRKIGYIDKVVLKLIGSLLLVLIAFVFRISPNEKVKIIYKKFDNQINKTYDLTFAKDNLKKIGLDVDKLKDLMGRIEDKTEEVIKEIMN